jgi:hypothetical protein
MDPPRTPTGTTPIRAGSHRARNQYESPQPYMTTRPVGTPSTPASYHAPSVPPSPYPGLTEYQVKQLNKSINKTNSKVEFSHDLLRLFGLDVSREEIIQKLGEWAYQRPPIRMFSRFTAEDFEKLCPNIENVININEKVLLESIPDQLIPNEFLPMLHISRSVSSRNNEMGTRKIIDLFMDTAVYIARKVFNEPRLVVHHEWEPEPVNIPGFGIVSGPLDYVTSRASGHTAMGTFQIFYY